MSIENEDDFRADWESILFNIGMLLSGIGLLLFVFYYMPEPDWSYVALSVIGSIATIWGFLAVGSLAAHGYPVVKKEDK